jgi:hypothetical protein
LGEERIEEKDGYGLHIEEKRKDGDTVEIRI